MTALPYTPAVAAGDLLFVSGQVGLVDGDLVDGFEDQCVAALNNLQHALRDNGRTLSDLVKTTVFVTNAADLAAMNKIYGETFSEPRPARSTVVVSALPYGACFEIEGIASASEAVAD